MRRVHQFNGTVGVQLDEKTYRDSDENFAADFRSAVPKLPAGINERLYEPGVRHALIGDHNVKDGGGMPWPEGDAIIDKIDDLLAAKATREEAEQAKLQAEFEKRMRENAAAQGMKGPP